MRSDLVLESQTDRKRAQALSLWLHPPFNTLISLGNQGSLASLQPTFQSMEGRGFLLTI